MKPPGPRPARRAPAGSGDGPPPGASPALTSDVIRALFDVIPDSIVMIGSGDRVVEANASACALVGLPRPEVIGARVTDFLQPGPDYRAVRAGLMRDGKARGVVRLRLADGKVHDIDIDAHAHIGPGIHLMVLRDVTDRSRYEHALRRAEHRFHAVFDGIADAIVVLSPEDTIRDANAAAAAILGASRGELLGRPMAEFFDSRDVLAQPRAELAIRGRAEGRTRLRRKDGSIEVEFVLTGFGDPHRSLLILSLPAQAGDETPSEPLFRRAFESSPAPTLVFDRGTGRIVAANRAAIEEYGYTQEEFLALDLEALRPSQHQTGKAWDQGGLWRHRRKDGSLIEVEATCEALGPAGGTEQLLISHEPATRQMAAHHFSLSAELFEASSQAILVTDAQSHIVAANPAFARITGYACEEVLGRNPALLASGRHDAAFYEEMWKSIRNDGHWQGEIWNRRKNGEVYPEWLTISVVKNRHGETVQYVGMFSDISERKAAEARIEYLAHYDSLTGLPNRSLLQDRFALAIAQARRSHRRVGVLFLDLDRFKKVNDTLGHSAGDAVLQQTAQRLRGCLRQADFVARQGGDEFIVLISDVDMIHDAAHVAQKIIQAMGRTMQVHGHEIHMSPSIGISIYPDDGGDIESLLKNADIAMYQAKNAGRNNYQFFAQDMNETAIEHLAFETSLRHALENREFVLHYQPQVDAASGSIVGVEALIRWHHPELGMVSPAQFIPVAEESGLIVPISAWVLRTACAQAADWQQSHGHALRMSVNVSALQFRHRDFVELVTDTLSQGGIDPGSLELELTESVVMHDVDAVIAKLFALREVGVSLAIDDFGTGYSSLSYLKRFPLDRLKIDQSFVRDIGRNGDSEAIIQAIVGMAHSMRLKTLAEGVETAEQLDFLRALKCDEIQGYLFSRPLPAGELPRLIDSGLAKT